MDKPHIETPAVSHEKQNAWDEKRIKRLEDGYLRLDNSIQEVSKKMSDFTVQNEERSKLLFNQNESLIRQNQSLLDTVNSIFTSITGNQDKKSERDYQLKKLKLVTQGKFWSAAIGAGGVIYLVVEFILNLSTK